MIQALITGGAGGIGLATARALVARDVRVVVADVAQPPDDLAARFVRADVRDADEWETLVEEAGPFDLALLNAGVASRTADLLAVDVEEVERVLRIDVDGVILGTRAVARQMAAGGGGSIVATASLAGIVAFAPDPVYCAAKHAVVGWVRAIAPQLAEHGIRINAVCPGIVDTAIIRGSQRAALEAASYPFMAPEQVADAVLDRFDADTTGEAWVCQPGRDALRFDFRGAPGPAGDVGRPPPEMSERA